MVLCMPEAGNDKRRTAYAQLREGSDELQVEADSPQEEAERGRDMKCKFKWNNRDCVGNLLHEEIVTRDDVIRDRLKKKGAHQDSIQHQDIEVCRAEACRELLDRFPEFLTERFEYKTVYKDTTQEGSGEAIHLAASRGYVEVSKLLLQRGAKLDAMVTRSFVPHYDVLHAAVWAEGRGGGKEIISFLLKAKAPLSENLDGHYPLHKAFQAGNKVGIFLLREERHRRGEIDIEKRVSEKSTPTPLEYGIKFGKMSEDELASVAPLTPIALHVFSGWLEGCIAHEPRCIPKWLERCQWPANRLAKKVTVLELAKVLNEAPESGDALLRALTSQPRIMNPGWHPLPSRVSFAPITVLDRIKAVGNPRTTHLSFYEDEDVWNWDSTTFQPPEWHASVPTPGVGAFVRPIRDVDVSVCHVPDLVAPELFLAIASAAVWKDEADEVLTIFTNPVVRGLISYVWWSGACKVEFVSLAFEIWGLMLLIIDQAVASQSYWDTAAMHEAHPDGRLLRHGGGSDTGLGYPTHRVGGPGKFNDFDVELSAMDMMLAEHRESINHIMTSFIGAWGVVGVLSELLSFGGFCLVGKRKDYFTVGSVCAVLQAFPPIYLMYNPEHVMMGVCVIMMYWVGLVKICYFSENIGRVFLPITDLAFTLGPAVVLTVIAFCAFLHSLFKVKEESAIPPDIIFLQSFTTLFTSELPPRESGQDVLMFACVSVLIFTLFILNIFIGVISEAYIEAKQHVALRYQQVISDLCTKFLLRCKCLRKLGFPMQLANSCAICAIGTCHLCIIIMQSICAFYNLQWAHMGACNAMFMSISALAAYHHSAARWLNALNGYKGQKQYYLWVVMPRTSGDEMDAEFDEMLETMEHVRQKTAKLREQRVARSSWRGDPTASWRPPDSSDED